MRLFTAIELDDATRALCGGVIDRLRREAPSVRWVAPHLLHVTVRFLGDVEERDLDEVRAALVEASAAARGPLRLRASGVDGFPHLGDPRVVFVGLQSGPGLADLIDLAQRIDAALAPLGFEPESRPFHAHVTLGRADRDRGGRGRAGGRSDRGPEGRRGAGGPGALARAAVAARALAEGAPFEVHNLALFRSELGRGGPTYTRLEAIPLGTGGA